MKCYSHPDREAVGICKACSKGICSECAMDTGNGLACADTCVGEVNALHEMIERSKKIYDLGQSRRSFPAYLLIYAFFGVMFIAWGAYSSLSYRAWDVFTPVMGLGFLGIGAYLYVRHKKNGTIC